jgi:leader peptidase (prepilin peptidase) / N-methyltransferase
VAVWAGLAVAVWLVSLTAVDVREHRLPNVLTLPGAVLIVAGAVAAGRGLPAFVGALALAGGYLVVHLLSPAAMGAGDVKLALGLGALAGAFGTDAWVWAALGAPMLTALWGLLSRRRVLPHGPAMCAATAAAVLLVFCGV